MIIQYYTMISILSTGVGTLHVVSSIKWTGCLPFYHSYVTDNAEQGKASMIL